MTGPSAFDIPAEQVRTQIGFKLFTVLGWVPQQRTLRRLWSSNPMSFTVGGEKTTEVDPTWLSGRVDEQLPFLGADPAAVRSVFRDHDLIESLGCGSVMNTTVIADGRTLAVLSVLDAAGAFSKTDLSRLVELTSSFLPAVRLALRSTNRESNND